jgi:hypothetical protein
LTNVPKNGLRWSINAIEAEWGVNRSTAKAKLAQTGQTPDENGFWTTVQVFNALTGGDIKEQRLREVRERADKLAIANARARDQFLDARDVRKNLEEVFAVMRSEILGNPDLTEEAQDSLLSHLSGYSMP